MAGVPSAPTDGNNRSCSPADRESSLAGAAPSPAFRAPRLAPELARDRDGIDAGLLPPGGFVAHAVHQPMMDAAERNREFVAGLAAQGPRLHEPKMMRIGRLAAAEQAGLSGDVAKVRLVAVTAGQRESRACSCRCRRAGGHARQRPVPAGLWPPRQRCRSRLPCLPRPLWPRPVRGPRASVRTPPPPAWHHRR